MRALKRPTQEHTYDADTEISHLKKYRDKVHQDPARNRHIPAVGQAGQVLIATWNIANLGVHKRRQSDFKVIAAVLSWFEIVAVQEVADNLSDFFHVLGELPNHFDWVFNDRAGNDERSAYIFNTRRVSLGPKIGEVVITETDRKHVKLPGIQRKFHGFNRNPYLASFTVENTDLLLANCHLLYGKQDTSALKKESMERRQLEALTRRGLRLPPHETRIPTNVSGTADYDQIAVTPGVLSRITKQGVFDFDGAIFADIYDKNAPGYWRTCAKYYISDHRPLWVQFELRDEQ